jgi:hypothetical protein
MQATVETITPAVAEAMLGTSAGNRRMKAEKVRSYARDMIAGRWVLNGETIITAADGRLIDGHHRLRACVESGCSFQTLAVRGVDQRAATTVDMGASRTIADLLSFEGERNCNAMVSIVNAAVSIKHGRPRSANLSSAEVLDFIAHHPKTRDLAQVKYAQIVPRIGAVLGGLGVVANVIGRTDDYDDFMAVLRSGVPSREGCPAHALRDRMFRDAASKKPMPLQQAHRLAVSAFNKFLRSDRVSVLREESAYFVAGWSLSAKVAAQ